MAQNTRTWDELFQLTQARAGTTFAGAEVQRVGWLLNSAARIMYDENPWWERFLVLEPRSVERGYVAYTEDGYNVYGAGTTEVNGLYVRNGSVNAKPAYTMYDADGTTPLYDVEWDNSTDWQILDATDAVIYDITDSSATPPESGWAAGTGESPGPLVQALSEVGEYIGHWNGAKFQCAGAFGGTAYPDHNGIRMTDCTQDGVVYMAFKKTQPSVYGDGSGGTISAIPSEWFEYMAYHAARSYRASQGVQINPVARADVQGVMDQSLLKINRQGIYNSIAKRFRTYYGYDISVR